MTLGEFRAMTAGIPNSARLVVDGCEGGCDEPKIAFGTTKPLGYDLDHHGVYDDLDCFPHSDVEPGSFAAVCITRDGPYDTQIESYAEALAIVEAAK